MFTPVVNGLEGGYGDEINFYRFDADDPVNQRLQNSLQLRGHPSVAIVDKNDGVVQRFFGVQPAEEIESVLDSVK